MKRKLLTVRHVAEQLDISTTTVYRLLQTGRLPFVTVSTKRLVPFHRIHGLKATPVYHQEKHVTSIDLDRIIFEGLPVASRRRFDMRHVNGKFAPKYLWPEIERQRKLTAIERLDEIDFSKL
jgi:excisionase family DNA binding protein